MTTTDDLVRDLVEAAPELNGVLQEHLADNDELLPHVLFGDVTRWLVEHGPNPAALAVLERHMVAGDEAVQNVLAVSFLENLLFSDDPAELAVRAALGVRLRAELHAMENWHEVSFQRLAGAVNDILYDHWDPIGVRGDAPRDEYESYVPVLIRLARDERSPVQSIAAHLGHLEVQEMGLDVSTEANRLDVARRIVDAVRIAGWRF